MKPEVIFKILAVIFIGIAAFFLWQGSKDGTFIVAVIGCVCFFLSIRFQVVERNKIRESELKKEEELQNPKSEI